MYLSQDLFWNIVVGHNSGIDVSVPLVEQIKNRKNELEPYQQEQFEELWYEAMDQLRTGSMSILWTKKAERLCDFF